MSDRQVVLGTRGSLLARWQADWVQALLRQHHPGLDVRQELISTQGDRVLDVALSQIGGKGVFTKELDLALEGRTIDLAVHSLKDVPTELPPGMVLAAVLPRADWRDAWVGPCDLADLPAGARVGTGSLRRGVQLRRLRPDVEILDLRGNVDTRLRKLDEGQYDAIILAAAGLSRLGRGERIRQLLPFIPAAGQGAVAVQARADDAQMIAWLRPLHDEATALSVRAERAWLATMEGGCQVPMGALAELGGDTLRLQAFAADPGGEGYLEAADEGPAAEPEALGRRVAERLLADGARDWRVGPDGRDPSIA